MPHFFCFTYKRVWAATREPQTGLAWLLASRGEQFWVVQSCDGSPFVTKTISAAIHTISLRRSATAGETDTFFLSKETSAPKPEVISFHLHVTVAWLLISASNMTSSRSKGHKTTNKKASWILLRQKKPWIYTLFLRYTQKKERRWQTWTTALLHTLAIFC